MSYSRRKAAAVRAVTGHEIAAKNGPHAAPDRRGVPSYVPMGYGPEKAILTFIAALVVAAAGVAYVEYCHWKDLPAEIGHTVEEMTQ